MERTPNAFCRSIPAPAPLRSSVAEESDQYLLAAVVSLKLGTEIVIDNRAVTN
jgi:hypothetical protein